MVFAGQGCLYQQSLQTEFFITVLPEAQISFDQQQFAGLDDSGALSDIELTVKIGKSFSYTLPQLPQPDQRYTRIDLEEVKQFVMYE